jgi:uncharacterized protein with PQ loop repeat
MRGSNFCTSLVQFLSLPGDPPAGKLARAMSDPASTLGATATAYSVIAGAALLLQMRTMLLRASSRDVSIGFLATASGGYLIWLLYGLAIDSMPLIFSDAIGLASSLAAVTVAGLLRRPVIPWRTRTRRA